MRIVSLSAALVICLQAAPASARKAVGRPIVAVFDLQLRGFPLEAELVGRLSELLAMSLGAGGVYRVVPRAQLHKRLRSAKKASYKKCTDQSCQIAIGRELAAQKSLSTQVLKLGKKCVVAAVMYDLAQSLSEGGARAEASCDVAGLTRALKSIVAQLEKLAPRPKKIAKPLPIILPKPRRQLVRLSNERLLFTTDTDRIFDVTVIAAGGAVRKCTIVASTPCALPRIALGRARVMIESKELSRFSRSITLDGTGEQDKQVSVKVKSRPSVGSILFWTFGGIAAATGAVLLPVGIYALDSSAMQVAGGISAGAGAVLIFTGFLFSSVVDAKTGFLNLGWDMNLFSQRRGSPPAVRVTVAPTFGGAAVVGSY